MSPLLLRRLTDEQLGGRLAHGEAAAFDELYRRYIHRLAAYGAHLLGDGVAGDDVAQSALLKAYTALRDGRAPDQIRPWLYRIAHNAAIDLVRRRRELPAEGLPERVALEPGPQSGAIVAALASLPDRQRKVYVLRELHGLRIDETAAELGLSAPQVEQALFAARNRMAEHLVFGERLSCVVVRRLAAGPLEVDERRALKTHLRSCAGCAATARVLAGLPAPLEWLRGLAGLLAGGGAPAAAKVGVLVAGATLAAGIPGAVEQIDQGPVPHLRVAAQISTLEHIVRRPVVPVAPRSRILIATPVPPSRAEHRDRVEAHDRTDSGGRPGPAETSGTGGGDGAAATSGSSDGGELTVTPATTAAPFDGGGSSGSGGGGGDLPASTGSSSGSGDGGAGRDGGTLTTTDPTLTVDGGGTDGHG